eukprot:TRINITY_DN11334_c0_g1_i1.p1 TRINITY_DN11334_c0_g1~~TRINITY_DN11334_c0_g1_i1.p1  ORF type:complete len:518 (+),score=95.95 TRINITY_DN11334_c0_g1_i1:83-1636(+)
MAEQNEIQSLVDQSSNQPVDAETTSSRSIQLPAGTRVLKNCRLPLLASSVLSLAFIAVIFFVSAHSEPQEATDVKELDFSEFEEFFRAVKKHPLGAKAFAEASAAFALKLKRVDGRRILEEIPVPVRSETADGSLAFTASWKKLPKPKVVPEDLNLELPARRLSVLPSLPLSGVSESTKLHPSNMDLKYAPLLRQISEMMPPPPPPPQPPTQSPLSNLSSPQSVRAFDITSCFLNAYQSLQYLVYAGLTIYYCTLKQSAADLAGDILGVIASFSWVASYIAAGVSACIPPGEGTNGAASCASDAVWVEGNFPQLAEDALGVVADCGNSNSSSSSGNSANTAQVNSMLANTTTGSKWRKLQGMLKKIRQKDPEFSREEDRRLRGGGGAPNNSGWAVSLVSCVFDSQAMASFFAWFGLQVVTQMQQCVDMDTQKKEEDCAWTTMYAIENFGWAVEYILQSINDCDEAGNTDALCAEDIADLVMTGSSMVPAVAWMKEACIPEENSVARKGAGGRVVTNR